ncbi:hypothetical protein IDG59_14600 [Staphylococcus sp. EG-SA-1]|nr:hypothetical protein [Staphylococcus sp. EG-SA-1]
MRSSVYKVLIKQLLLFKIMIKISISLLIMKRCIHYHIIRLNHDRLTLVSLNKDYDDLHFYRNESVRLIGKVIL